MTHTHALVHTTDFDLGRPTYWRGQRPIYDPISFKILDFEGGDHIGAK